MLTGDLWPPSVGVDSIQADLVLRFGGQLVDAELALAVVLGIQGVVEDPVRIKLCVKFCHVDVERGE